MPFGTGLIGLGVSLAPTIFQSILGANQSKQAEDVSPGARPKYEIPSAEKASLDLTRMLAGSNAPGYNIAKADIEGAGANNLLTGIKFGGADVAQTYKNQTDALSDLNAGNEAFRERQLNNLTNKLSEFAGYQDKAFDINKMQPYEYALNQSKELKDASNQNIYGALSDASSGVLELMKTFNGGVGATGKTANPTTQDFEAMTNNPQFWEQLKTSDPATYAKLSDAMKQKSATNGGVVGVESNPALDQMLQSLISGGYNPFQSLQSGVVTR